MRSRFGPIHAKFFARSSWLTLPPPPPELQHHQNDLSSIVAFNQSYDQSNPTSTSHSPQDNPNSVTNQWGKRPSPDDPSHDGADSNKRQQLEGVNSGVQTVGGLNVSEAQLAATLRAVNGDYGPVDENVIEDDDDEDDPDYVMDEEENEQEHERMRAQLNAANGQNPWANPMGLLDANFQLWDAKQNLRVQSLPILDNLVSPVLVLRPWAWC